MLIKRTETLPGRVRRTADPSASLGMTKERVDQRIGLVSREETPAPLSTSMRAEDATIFPLCHPESL
jgi:hypothetical protein